MTLWSINRAAHGRRENYAIKIIQIKEGFCVCESGFTMYEFFKMDDRVLKAAGGSGAEGCAVLCENFRNTAV